MISYSCFHASPASRATRTNEQNVSARAQSAKTRRPPVKATQK